MRTPHEGRRKIGVKLYFTPKALLELEELAEKLNLSRSGAVAQALAWFQKTEPRAKPRAPTPSEVRKRNGSNQSPV